MRNKSLTKNCILPLVFLTTIIIISRSRSSCIIARNFPCKRARIMRACTFYLHPPSPRALFPSSGERKGWKRNSCVEERAGVRGRARARNCRVQGGEDGCASASSIHCSQGARALGSTISALCAAYTIRLSSAARAGSEMFA